MTNSQAITQIHLGHQAFTDGLHAHDNPNPRGSLDWSRWNYGWTLASKNEPIERDTDGE